MCVNGWSLVGGVARGWFTLWRPSRPDEDTRCDVLHKNRVVDKGLEGLPHAPGDWPKELQRVRGSLVIRMLEVGSLQVWDEAHGAGRRGGRGRSRAHAHADRRRPGLR